MKSSRKPVKKARRKALTITHPNAAGIDVGSGEHYVAVGEDRSDSPVRCFGCMTRDLQELTTWLQECDITTVAMESTGVYWIPVAQVLDEQGIEVVLVHAAHVKAVPGRKSDVLDCQWLQRLHSYGLLRGAFRPAGEITVLRGYWRHREMLVQERGRYIQRMQKALVQMNIHIHKVISDISGLSGMAIIRAILAGERDGKALAQLANYRVKRSKEEIAQALTGNWREEQLYVLGDHLEIYEQYQRRIAACDQRIEAYLIQLGSMQNPAHSSPIPTARKRKTKNAPAFDMRGLHHGLAGVDLTQIDGIDEVTAQTIYAEIGFNVDAFPTEKHFASWLGLCPNNRVTGGKIKGSRSKTVVSRVATAFRKAAFSLHHSKSWMGAYYRKMRSRLGPQAAITATAHKLAKQVYRMLKHGGDYQDKGMEQFERQQQQREMKILRKLAGKHNLEILCPDTGEVMP